MTLWGRIRRFFGAQPRCPKCGHKLWEHAGGLTGAYGEGTMLNVALAISGIYAESMCRHEDQVDTVDADGLTRFDHFVRCKCDLQAYEVWKNGCW